MRWLWMFPCVLVACDVSVKFDDVFVDGDVQPGKDRPDDEPSPGEDSGPVLLTSWEVYCDGREEHILAQTSSPASAGYFYQQETANVPPNWSDYHTLELVAPGADGLSKQLERKLLDGRDMYNPAFDWERDYSTAFVCEWHIEDPDVDIMSYAIAVYDADGNLSDCVAFGEDPQGMVDGDYEYAGQDPPFDLSLCRVE